MPRATVVSSAASGGEHVTTRAYARKTPVATRCITGVRWLIASERRPRTRDPLDPHGIRAMRLAAGWSQSKLAESLEVAQQTVSKWESGDESPTDEMLQAARASLGAGDWHGLQLVPVGDVGSAGHDLPVGTDRSFLEPKLSIDQLRFRRAVVSRIDQGTPLSDSELEVLHGLAALHGLQLRVEG